MTKQKARLREAEGPGASYMTYWDYVSERLPPAKIKWPNGARMAVCVLFDYQAEMGTTYKVANGDPNYAQITEASYGGRVAIWRLLDILDRHDVKASFNTCGVTAEHYPESARAIVERGHEIAGHAYNHELQWELSAADEADIIRKTVASIKRITGERIVGWRCPRVEPSPHTLRILADEGFVWDGDFLNYDLPYMLDIKTRKGRKSMVEIPYTFSTDDYPFVYGTANRSVGGFPSFRNSYKDLYQILRDEFDMLYKESATTPKMFAFQNHPLCVGRAHRAKYFEMLLAYMKTFPDVWFAKCIDVANWWLKHYDAR
jgi:peptidoglycan/xylan/chitin deacetylase (PgdA/CDA1 family)